MHAPDRNELNAGGTVPVQYGADRLVLLPKDPHWLFAYWEVTLELEESVRAYYPGVWDRGRMILRLFNVDNGACRDINIGLRRNNYYLPADCADSVYRAALGMLLPDQAFIQLLLSNTVRTPRDSLSAVIDPRWKMFPFWQQGYFRRMLNCYSSSHFIAQNNCPQGKEIFCD